MIDFGLASSNPLPEDKAVDLYVMERAFHSTHIECDALVHKSDVIGSGRLTLCLILDGRSASGLPKALLGCRCGICKADASPSPW